MEIRSIAVYTHELLSCGASWLAATNINLLNYFACHHQTPGFCDFKRQVRSAGGAADNVTKTQVGGPTFRGPTERWMKDCTDHMACGTFTMLGRCTMRSFSFARRTRLQPTSMIGRFCCRELSATSQLPSKQQMDGFTVKDTRTPRPRVAKEKRKQYLAQRKASFEAEQNKAASLGLDWGIRSAL